MKKRMFLLAVLIAIVSVSSFGQNAKKYYKAGVEFQEGFKYDDAIAQYTSAIGLEPSNPDYYIARGEVYLIQSKYAEAKADYEKAIVFEPKEVHSYVSLGAICNKMGNYEEALRFLNHASGLDKREPKVYPEKVFTLYQLGKFDQALKVSDTAIIIKDNATDYYWRGKIFRKLGNDVTAKKELEKSIAKDKKLPEPRLELADLLLVSNPLEAMNQCNEVLKNDPKSTEGYTMRSKVYRKNLDYPNAINDISKNILIDPSNPQFYYDRGICYQEFNQHTNAINDFSKYIALKPDDYMAYFARAKSYEEIMSVDKAIADYAKITVLAEFNQEARKMMKDAEARLYKLNEEKDPPLISVVSPVPIKDTIEIRGDKAAILITGKIKDKSKLRAFSINNGPVNVTEKNGEYDFLSNIDVTGLNTVTLVARDDYDNEKTITFPIKRTEIDPPSVSLEAPYTSEDGQVFLDGPAPNIAIQGRIADMSRIKSITVGNRTASYDPNQMNPEFTANIDISNISKFTVAVEDIYGNRKEMEFTLNRDGAAIAANNPMGRTWVVFIENSSYETFASLDGPIKDVASMQRALANYQIHNIIHKKDMTKAEMEKFFNIELRDLAKKNQVKSLMVWYAGHGKFINDIGYWIPVDAKRDDEFTYFNINALKAGLQGYGDVVVHTLIVSDACESGPGFYTAMRGGDEMPTCADTKITGLKSAQVFTSANTELASDNSKFTATFANALTNNKNACIPIDIVAKTVTSAVSTDNGQKPKFGKIQGLEDMGGTFFFISK